MAAENGLKPVWKFRRRAKGGLTIYGMGVPLNSRLKKKLDTSVFCS